MTAAKAVFLIVVKEWEKETTYRDLASSDYVKNLGISGVHYTTIHKAVKRLSSGLLETAMRLFGKRVSKDGMDCVFDATGVKIRRHEKKIYAGEERRERQGVKLNAA